MHSRPTPTLDEPVLKELRCRYPGFLAKSAPSAGGTHLCSSASLASEKPNGGLLRRRRNGIRRCAITSFTIPGTIDFGITISDATTNGSTFVLPRIHRSQSGFVQRTNTS